MTDPVPSKDQLPEHLQDWRKVLKRGRRINDAMDQIRAEFGLFEGAVKIVNLEDEIERLRTALRGIQSCSTCEACRGAATRALGGSSHEPAADLAKWLRQEASFWRDDAFENAAKICERYEAHDAARDIRHLKGSSKPPGDGQ